MRFLRAILQFTGTLPKSRFERSVRSSRRSLRLEALECRAMFAVTGFEPTANEQYMLELVNRARLDPAGEVERNTEISDLNQFLTPGTISSDPKQPLAFNLDLIEAARGHSGWMISTNAPNLTHSGPNNNTPRDRMAEAGYAPAGSFGSGENVAYRGTTGQADETAFVLVAHNSLFTSKDHRTTIMNPDYREIGIGNQLGRFLNSNALVITQDFASRRSKVFLTGVVFDDKTEANRFYTVGEGLGGIRIQAKRMSDNAVSETTSFDSGGYQIELQPGTYEVQFSGNGVPGTLTYTATLGSENVKVDVNTAAIQNLSVSINDSIMSERNGRMEATVTRNTSDLSSDLAVNVASNLPSGVIVPARVIIPANQASMTFEINAVDDSEKTLTRSSAIMVSAANFATASSMVHVIDDESPSIWKNPRNPYDIDDNESVEPLDILLVINQLRRQSGPLAPNVQLSPPVYYDVDGDWLIVPLDVLLIINQFSRRTASAEGENPLSDSVGQANLAASFNPTAFPLGYDIAFESYNSGDEFQRNRNSRRARSP